MQDDSVPLLDEQLAREQAQAIRRSGDEDACHPPVIIADR
jgi:hypothetical protein